MTAIQNLNLSTAAELSITAMVVFVLTQAIKQTRLDNRWLPWVSMLLGIIAGLVSVAVTGDSNWSGAGLAGLLVGGWVSGLFDGVKGLSKTSFGTTEVTGNADQAPDPLSGIVDLGLAPEHKDEGSMRDEGAQPKGGEGHDGQ